jgi:(p)ppGpp synthase/HD superfamily hydrolase
MNINDAHTIVTAASVAEVEHRKVGQVRKYTGEPYIVHPNEVARIVASVTNDSAVIAASFLHDTLEDTEYTGEELYFKFGKDIHDLVVEMTKVTTEADGNRKALKAIEHARLATVSQRAKTIKLADLISNSRTIILYDPEFAKVYMDEFRNLLGVLEEGDPVLLETATDIVNDYFSD